MGRRTDDREWRRKHGELALVPRMDVMGGGDGLAPVRAYCPHCQEGRGWSRAQCEEAGGFLAAWEAAQAYADAHNRRWHITPTRTRTGAPAPIRAYEEPTLF